MLFLFFGELEYGSGIKVMISFIPYIKFHRVVLSSLYMVWEALCGCAELMETECLVSEFINAGEGKKVVSTYNFFTK